MILFNTRNTDYLATQLGMVRGACTIKNFSDKEMYIKVDEDVTDKDVYVLTATQPPADNIFELCLLLDALKRQKAKISVLFTYFGYARQDRIQPGEAFSAHMISDFLKTFDLKNIIVVHAHSNRLHEMLDFQNIIPIDLFCDVANMHRSLIAAPDKGASDFATQVADQSAMTPIFITKTRPALEKVVISQAKDHIGDTITNTIDGKNILIVDDMIATGSTIIQAASFLKQRGAADIYACATHGVFAPGAREAMETATDIKTVYVSNSLPQPNTPGKIKVINIAPFLKEAIQDLIGRNKYKQ